MQLFMIHRIQLFMLPSTIQFFEREEFSIKDMKTTSDISIERGSNTVRNSVIY